MERNLLTHHSHSFEDFQKSEMIKSELIEDGFVFTIIGIIRNDTLLILKSTIQQLLIKQ